MNDYLLARETSRLCEQEREGVALRKSFLDDDIASSAASTETQNAHCSLGSELRRVEGASKPVQPMIMTLQD